MKFQLARITLILLLTYTCCKIKKLKKVPHSTSDSTKEENEKFLKDYEKICHKEELEALESNINSYSTTLFKKEKKGYSKIKKQSLEKMSNSFEKQFTKLSSCECKEVKEFENCEDLKKNLIETGEKIKKNFESLVKFCNDNYDKYDKDNTCDFTKFILIKK